jgi:hypothetical protein
MNTPECSEWKLWIGHEIEGTKDLGVKTLFVREASNSDIIKNLAGVPRVWFCKEFVALQNWGVLPYLKGRAICVEMTVEFLQRGFLPQEVRDRCTVYLKVPVTLFKGDFICVGQAFKDESFEVGKGAVVTPDQYNKDVKIL